MRDFVFLWSWRNEQHIGEHGIEPEEAEYVADHAASPYPEARGEQRYVVWGRTEAGRFLQIVFVFVKLADVLPDELLRLELNELAAMEDGEDAVRIIHSRDLTPHEKRRLRRRKR